MLWFFMAAFVGLFALGICLGLREEAKSSPWEKEASGGRRTVPKGRVTEWKHGFETPLVRATRYSNPHMGFNIGFVLLKHPHDCDRASMMDWLKSKGVHTYQCGGYPGAEILTVVSGVSSKEAANEWLPKFLSEFDGWIRTNLSNK